jgi:hypothetical protein
MFEPHSSRVTESHQTVASPVSGRRADAQAYDPKARERLWRLSEELVGLG